MKIFQKITAGTACFLLAAAICGGPSAQALAPGDMLVPVGQAVGIQLSSQGVIVSGLAQVETASGGVSPAEDAGILPGDRITSLDGQPISCGEDFLRAVSSLTGSPVTVEASRNGESFRCTITPLQNARGVWQLGLWLRDSVAGIGTITFWDPASGAYGALGHGVCLPETGELMVITDGVITPASVSGVVAGQRGQPGELCGVPSSGETLGTIQQNTICGIFGQAGAAMNASRAPIPAAAESEIHTGPATILATVGQDGPREYGVEILRVLRDGDDLRQLTIAVTDPKLLAITGGIVQGMSGSPILQDGKLVGAVTHVLVGDPTKGYGISIENMLQTGQAALAGAA